MFAVIGYDKCDHNELAGHCWHLIKGKIAFLWLLQQQANTFAVESLWMKPIDQQNVWPQAKGKRLRFRRQILLRGAEDHWRKCQQRALCDSACISVSLCVALLSPSGDLGIGLVWDNLSPPNRSFLARLLKSSSNWTKLSMRSLQLFSGWYQMISDVFRCSQQFSDVFRLLSDSFPNFFSDCWNPLQAELDYLWWVLICSQDDISDDFRCFPMFSAVFRCFQRGCNFYG